MSRLVTDMNITTGSGRPSWNSQGICNTLLQPTRPTTLLPETPVIPATIPSTPVNLPLARSILPDNRSHAATDTPISNSLIAIPTHDKQIEVLTPCMQQHDRFVDPSGKPLQPGTVIICEDLPLVVSSNGRIYNFTGGNMKQLYIADPSEHKFLVKAANSPSTFCNILGSVLGLLPGFHRRQNQINSSEEDDQEQAVTEASTIESINTIHSAKGLEWGNHVDTISEDNTSDLANFCTNEIIHYDIHDAGLFITGNMFPDHACNKMLSHCNIVIGCFKDIFQSVDMYKLSEVLQALKKLNFVLANRAPELAAHYGMPLEPQLVSAEEVPDLINAHLNRPTAYNMQHGSRGIPCLRGNQHNRYNRQSSPLPRYNQQTSRSDIHIYFHKNRSYNNTIYHHGNGHNSILSIRNMHNASNNTHNSIGNMQ